MKFRLQIILENILFCSCEVLWDIAGESKNYNMLTGHKNAVLEVKWSPSSGSLISCSADKTVGESLRQCRCWVYRVDRIRLIAHNHKTLAPEMMPLLIATTAAEFMELLNLESRFNF